MHAPIPLDTRELLARAAAWCREGRTVALATVIVTWGSSPRPVGSMLTVDSECRILGSVSGGCVESAVVQEAQTVMADGRPRTREFGVSNEQAWAVGLACGGRIRIYVERLRTQQLSLLDDLEARLQAKRGVVRVMRLTDGTQYLLEPTAEPDAPLAEAATAALRADRSTMVSGADGAEYFLQIHNPPLHLLLVGAVHIAQALAPMAQLAGYAVTVIDPRAAFLSTERFPQATRHVGWPRAALAALVPDSRCAIITLSHDPKIDDPALIAALDSEVFYVGALGSRRTHARRLERLAAAGMSEAQLARIHAPVGFPIGARSPAEIAVSILAEMTAAVRKTMPA